MKARTLWIAGILLALAMIAPHSALAKVKGDRDRNGIPDSWEVRYGLKKSSKSQKKATKRYVRKAAIRIANADPDQDDLSNVEEWRGHTNPKNDDTDGDGVLDGDENGVVISFNGNHLRVLMPGEGLVEGVVDEDTLVFCEPGDGSIVDDEEQAVEDDPYSDVGDDFDATDDQVVEEEFDWGNVQDTPSNQAFVDTGLCDVENIEVGTEVMYVDDDDGYFTDVTLDTVPFSVDDQEQDVTQ